MKILFTVLFILSGIQTTNSQDTFSITAYDPITGEVGSAGASCVANCIILSDVHPGLGVIHTQASYLASNQNYARTLFLAGYSPQQIIDSMIIRDAQNNPSVRQYGIIKSTTGEKAGYTGSNCLNYKNHLIGPTYTIQGNILSGQRILDSMEARFNREEGSLAKKLMAALQGAKILGADTRCSTRGTSSISSFIRVGRVTDPTNNLYLDLRVNNTPVGKDPIDSLQVLFNQWMPSGISQINENIPSNFILKQNYPNPFNPETFIEFSLPQKEKVYLSIFDISGKEIERILSEEMPAGNYIVNWKAINLPSGIYIYRLDAGLKRLSKKMLLVK
ncbi:MAG TPA: DUF1028 domain-containing protein [Ignavibacteria bacterium]|nr:DUF1028 domain-containing protein [Ignavibacteria bacterium]